MVHVKFSEINNCQKKLFFLEPVEEFWMRVLLFDDSYMNWVIDTQDFFLHNKNLRILKGVFCEGQIFSLIPFWVNLTELCLSRLAAPPSVEECKMIGRDLKFLKIFKAGSFGCHILGTASLRMFNKGDFSG